MDGFSDVTQQLRVLLVDVLVLIDHEQVKPGKLCREAGERRVEPSDGFINTASDTRLDQRRIYGALFITRPSHNREKPELTRQVFDHTPARQ
jgi:hypothetical protein